MKDTNHRGNRAGRATTQASRYLARVWLALSATLLAVFVLVGPSFGAAGAVIAQQTESPSPSPTGPTGPSIAFLNPAASYDPELPRPPRAGADRPKISDRFDGVDRAYHITAAVGSVPSNPIVEAYLLYPTALANEITIGPLDRVAGTDTWELFWDVPESLAEGNATMIVRLFSQTSTGIEEIANDEVLVELTHKGGAPPTPPDSQPADETVEITWPTNGGQLGFFRGSGPWITAIDGFASPRTEDVLAFYTTTPPGGVPEYQECGEAGLWNTPEYDAPNSELDPGIDEAAPFQQEIPFTIPCTLQGSDSPSSVTAVVLVPLETDEPNRAEARAFHEELTQDAADAHRVTPYIQDVASMSVEVLPNPNAQQGFNRRRTAGPSDTSTPRGGCLAFMVTVTDHLDRPVQGANVDVHAQGPGDQLQFGDESSTGNAARGSGGYKVPDKGAHSNESARDCDPTGAGNPPTGRFVTQGEQGEHNIPGGPDLKHRESTGGTGPAGGSPGGGRPPLAGQFRFQIFSENPGLTQITAWVDSESASNEAQKPEADDDELEAGEAFASTFGQWYSVNPTIDIAPAGGIGATGSCFAYTAKVRSGTRAVPGINVDVHARGPNDELDFCDTADTTTRRAPDRGPADDASPHQGEDDGESSHVEAAPRTQHTEGETDDAGIFVFGVTSPVVGDSTITAWVDGEREFRNDVSRKDSDNDIQAGSEPSITINQSWATAGDPRISFVNPSGYGGAGDHVGSKTDADSTYHLVARVASVETVAGVEFQISDDDGATFTKIGDASQVGTSDTWQLSWDVNVDDGDYVLRAVIVGTTVAVDRDIEINDTTPSAPPDPSDIPFQTAEITSPENGATASFDRGALTVRGVASAGADGVDLFYSKVSGITTAESASWTFCGFIDLAGATSPQGFSGACTPTGSDQPSQVTAIAALAVDCMVQNNCNAAPGSPRQAERESGDAHRVFGLEANPLVSIEPAEAEVTPGGCQRFVMAVFDQTGQPMGGANVDVHATGPSENISFCNPDDGSERRAPEDGGHAAESGEPNSGLHQEDGTHHTEGETGSNGRFIIGITSPNEGDTQILGWIDRTDNDVRDADENADTSVVHWASRTTGGGANCTITGTSGHDRLVGTDGDDVICGRGGNDTLIGKGGNDTLLGGRGRDILKGGPANDILKGGGGPDTLIGGAGADILRGGGGRDTLKGAAGDDRLFGGRGNDNLDGGRGRDSCRGGPGRDRIRRCEEGSSRTAGSARAL